MYAMVGFANGISNFANTAVTATKNASLSAIEALKVSMANLSTVVEDNLNTNPVIRPVVDLSDIIAGRKSINGVLSQGINVGAIAGRLPVIQTQSSYQESQNGSSSSPSGLSFVQNNYSPKALSRIEIYRQTQNQINAMKGLVRA